MQEKKIMIIFLSFFLSFWIPLFIRYFNRERQLALLGGQSTYRSSASHHFFAHPSETWARLRSLMAHTPSGKKKVKFFLQEHKQYPPEISLKLVSVCGTRGCVRTSRQVSNCLFIFFFFFLLALRTPCVLQNAKQSSFLTYLGANEGCRGRVNGICPPHWICILCSFYTPAG